MSELAWHYTTGQKFLLIVESGELVPTSIGVHVSEAPILWFSQNQIWEPTACKGMIDERGNIRTLNRHETREYGGGLVRFGLPRNQLLSWRELIAAANISDWSCRHLEQAGRAARANPDHWMGVLQPIPIDNLVVEVLEGKWEWVCVAPILDDMSASVASSY